MTRSPQVRRGGFTLFEVLVSIGLIALLVAAMAAFLNDALRIRERIGEAVERGVAADAVVAELERALETCVVDDRRLGSGVRGDATSIDVLRAGLSPWRLSTADPDRALESIDRLRIVFDPVSQRVGVGRGDQPVVPLPGIVTALRFRYFDGEEWVDTFDSRTRGHLPVAVEWRLWFRPLEVTGAATTAGTGNDEPSEADAIDDDRAVDDEELPPPDRRRVIAIPDAAGALDVRPATTRGAP